MIRERKPCRIWENRRPYTTIVSCNCGWMKSVFHRNALARASRANSIGLAHMRAVQTVNVNKESNS